MDGNLIVHRRRGESTILICGSKVIRVEVFEAGMNWARLRISAPTDVAIWREELLLTTTPATEGSSDGQDALAAV